MVDLEERPGLSFTPLAKVSSAMERASIHVATWEVLGVLVISSVKNV